MDKICLIGFMGSGKTTVGLALAQKLNVKWVDLDSYLVKKAGQSISTIFEEQGEQAFREMETKCMKEVLRSNVDVISTGGGIISSSSNREELQKCCTIFLEYPFDCLYERIKGDGDRPLVTSYEALHKRFDERMPLYEMASQIKIQCEDKSINAIVEEIIMELKNK